MICYFTTADPAVLATPYVQASSCHTYVWGTMLCCSGGWTMSRSGFRTQSPERYVPKRVPKCVSTSVCSHPGHHPSIVQTCRGHALWFTWQQEWRVPPEHSQVSHGPDSDSASDTLVVYSTARFYM